jgi:hypothetical protein
MFLASISVLLLCLLAMSHEGYLAPVAGMDNSDKYPDAYIVTLHRGHTLEQHFDAIGSDLRSLPGFRTYGFGYSAVMDDKTRDEQVRRDPGVRVVEANAPIYGFQLLDDVVLIESLKLLDNQT